jgi:hypothetical protein
LPLTLLPPPHIHTQSFFELISAFTDGSKCFELEPIILRAELQMQFYFVKLRKPKKHLQFLF